MLIKNAILKSPCEKFNTNGFMVCKVLKITAVSILACCLL